MCIPQNLLICCFTSCKWERLIGSVSPFLRYAILSLIFIMCMMFTIQPRSIKINSGVRNSSKIFCRLFLTFDIPKREQIIEKAIVCNIAEKIIALCVGCNLIAYAAELKAVFDNILLLRNGFVFVITYCYSNQLDHPVSFALFFIVILRKHTFYNLQTKYVFYDSHILPKLL